MQSPTTAPTREDMQQKIEQFAGQGVDDHARSRRQRIFGPVGRFLGPKSVSS